MLEQQQDMKDTIILELMEIGIYKIQDLQLYQVPLFKLLEEYNKHVH